MSNLSFSGVCHQRSLPSNIQNVPFSPFSVTWLSFLFMIVVGILLIYFVVQSTPMALDYAVTFTFVHFILSCIVTASFPVNWVWWVTVIIGTFLLSTGAEMSCYYLRDMRSIKVDHE